MALILPFLIFIGSLVGLIFSSNLLLQKAKLIGVSIGASPFIVGALILAFGTSLPELFISMFSVFNGAIDVPVSQVVGSNIVNVLLILGVVTIITRKIVVSKNLIDVELPLLAGVTSLFLFEIRDGLITLNESLILIGVFFIYILYLLSEEENRVSISDSLEETLSSLRELPKSLIFFVISLIGLAVFSWSISNSIESIADILNISQGFVAVTAVALGTSLPELAVSISAILKKEIEIVVGNIIGSNVFNILFVIGLPGLFSTLTIDEQSFSIGLPVLVISTVLFVISGISNKLHQWEGAVYICIYILFMLNLFGLV